MSVIEDKEYLDCRIKEFIKIVLEEFNDKITESQKQYILSLLQKESNIIMHDESINCFYREGKIYYPLQYYTIIDDIKNNDNRYGLRRGKVFVSDESKVMNDNNYANFFEYAILAGLTPREVFEMFTLHETMHLCGATGYEPLSEAFTELKARELSLKYGINAACCSYSDEVKIALKLQKIFGKEVCDALIFVPNKYKADYLSEYLNSECGNLYRQINNELNLQLLAYQNQRYESSGIKGIKEALTRYNNKDYANVYKLLDDFKSIEYK